MGKTSKELLFERMHTIGGMPLKEFDTVISPNSAKYQELINFIGNSTGYLIYLHTTNSEEVAKSICSKGFQFEDFPKTTDYIGNADGLIYMLNIRASYGNFTIIIQLRNGVNPESISKKSTDGDGEEIFILPPQYIKGYYDRATKKIYSNPQFKQ